MRGEPEAADLNLRAVEGAIRRHWRMVALYSMVGGILLATLGFVLPKRYVSTATLIPIGEPSKLSTLSKIAAGFIDVDAQPRSLDEAVPAYPVFVQSRRLASSLLGMRFPRSDGRDSTVLIDMIMPHGTGLKRTERAVQALRGDISASIDRRTGVLTIAVGSQDPVTAAAVASAAESLLQVFLTQTAARQASEQREFLEGRLADTQARLVGAEDDLRYFRERNVRIDRSPRLQVEEGRLQRAVREQEEIYLTLRREYELAKIAEHKNVPTISEVDPPAIPASHSWPPRRLFAVGGLLCGFVLGSGLAVRRSRVTGG